MVENGDIGFCGMLNVDFVLNRNCFKRIMRSDSSALELREEVFSSDLLLFAPLKKWWCRPKSSLYVILWNTYDIIESFIVTCLKTTRYN